MDEDTKALHSAVRAELKKELQNEKKSRALPPSWNVISVDKFYGGEKSILFIKRKLKDEDICLITSTEVCCSCFATPPLRVPAELFGQVMQSIADEVEDAEEKNPAEENGFDVPANSLLLVGITKPSQTEVMLTNISQTTAHQVLWLQPSAATLPPALSRIFMQPDHRFNATAC